MKTIALANGRGVALVDDEDFERINKYRWHNDRGYARRGFWSGGRVVQVRMHNEVLQRPSNPTVLPDHIDRDKLNNQKSNLRLVTVSQNNRNQGLNRQNTSGCSGVGWNKRLGLWRVWIVVCYRFKALGHFPTLEEACAARKAAESEL